ncbi:MAG: protein kinase [Kofleriaceae bacterium]
MPAELRPGAGGPTCPSCGAGVLEIDVRCAACGHALGSTGSQRLLGSVVLGHYELVDVLGQGGMSIVYLGRHQLTEQEVALKILPPELAAHAQVKSRFVEEAKALAALDHPHIVHLYNFGQENGSFVLAMQLVRGKTWERLILEHGRLGWIVTVRIAIDVLRALEYAHGRGVVHRDMKPSNVLIRSDDGTATVMDFGIAKMTTSTKLTATGQTMGTVRYMSPEQVRGQEVDATTDLYSLGATIYESLIGDTPFDGNTHFEIMTKHLGEAPRPPSARGVPVPPALDEAVLRALSKRPEERFASARAFRKALEAVVAEADASGDRGGAEAIRLARDSTPPRPKRGSVLPPTEPAPVVVEDAVSGPARAAAAAAISAVDVPADRERRMPTSQIEGARRPRASLILALVVLGAGAAVAVVMMTRRSKADAPVVSPATTAPAASIDTIRPYLPEGLALSSPVARPGLPVTARSVGAISAEAALTAVERTLTEFDVFAAGRGASRSFAPDALHVVVVPAEVLCAKATYTERRPDGTVVVGEPDPGCAELGQRYRPYDRTLLVAADADHLADNLRAGVADVVALHRGDLAEIAEAFRAPGK